jgi:hypothetical protein
LKFFSSKLEDTEREAEEQKAAAEAAKQAHECGYVFRLQIETSMIFHASVS